MALWNAIKSKVQGVLHFGKELAKQLWNRDNAKVVFEKVKSSAGPAQHPPAVLPELHVPIPVIPPRRELEVILREKIQSLDPWAVGFVVFGLGVLYLSITACRRRVEDEEEDHGHLYIIGADGRIFIYVYPRP